MADTVRFAALGETDDAFIHHWSAGPRRIAFFPTACTAHCDGLDGPVVAAAKQALETGDAIGLIAAKHP